MDIELTKEEQTVLWRYRKHLFKITGISYHIREVLKRIILECNQELDIIENDLRAEEGGEK